MNILMNSNKSLFIIMTLATLTLISFTLTGIGNVYAQVPPLESAEPQPQETTNETTSPPPISIGKVTIPVSSGEQIIIDVPLRDGNTYQLVPIN